jgi:hypothetical protein
VEKPEGRRPFRIPSLRREDNIKMDFRKVGLGHRPIWPWIGTGGGLL